MIDLDENLIYKLQEFYSKNYKTAFLVIYGGDDGWVVCDDNYSNYVVISDSIDKLYKTKFECLCENFSTRAIYRNAFTTNIDFSVKVLTMFYNSPEASNLWNQFINNDLENILVDFLSEDDINFINDLTLMSDSAKQFIKLFIRHLYDNKLLDNFWTRFWHIYDKYSNFIDLIYYKSSRVIARTCAIKHVKCDGVSYELSRF